MPELFRALVLYYSSAIICCSTKKSTWSQLLCSQRTVPGKMLRHEPNVRDIVLRLHEDDEVREEEGQAEHDASVVAVSLTVEEPQFAHVFLDSTLARLASIQGGFPRTSKIRVVSRGPTEGITSNDAHSVGEIERQVVQPRVAFVQICAWQGRVWYPGSLSAVDNLQPL